MFVAVVEVPAAYSNHNHLPETFVDLVQLSDPNQRHIHWRPVVEGNQVRVVETCYIGEMDLGMLQVDGNHNQVVASAHQEEPSLQEVEFDNLVDDILQLFLNF